MHCAHSCTSCVHNSTNCVNNCTSCVHMLLLIGFVGVWIMGAWFLWGHRFRGMDYGGMVFVGP